MKYNWIPWFSQTGTEILDIIKTIGVYPKYIVTNSRPDSVRTINKELLETYGDRFIYLPNKPSISDYVEIISLGEPSFNTLHGWLRVVPPEVCTVVDFYNGHPGLITTYSHLKGKDPQVRAFAEKLPVMGCVLHKVVPEVDAGEIIAESQFNSKNIDEERMWQLFRKSLLSLWVEFLTKSFELPQK